MSGAQFLGSTRTHEVSRITRTAFLAPAIVEAILDGKQPAHLTMEDRLEPFPVEWGEQSKRFV
jgi:site-specific DNA recombinase